MGFSELFAVSLQALRLNKLRSGLTLLGVIIGVMTVVSVLSVISGPQRLRPRTRSSTSTPTSSSSPSTASSAAARNSSWPRKRKPVTLRDLQIVRAECRSCAAVARAGSAVRERPPRPSQALERARDRLHGQRADHAQRGSRGGPLLHAAGGRARGAGGHHRARHQGPALPEARSHRPHGLRPRLSAPRHRAPVQARQRAGTEPRQRDVRAALVPAEGDDLGRRDRDHWCGRSAACRAWTRRRERSGRCCARCGRRRSRPRIRLASSEREAIQSLWRSISAAAFAVMMLDLGPLAGGRRHRGRQHHVRLGGGAHPGDRAAHGPGREEARHQAPVPDGVVAAGHAGRRGWRAGRGAGGPGREPDLSRAREGGFHPHRPRDGRGHGPRWPAWLPAAAAARLAPVEALRYE